MLLYIIKVDGGITHVTPAIWMEFMLVEIHLRRLVQYGQRHRSQLCILSWWGLQEMIRISTNALLYGIYLYCSL